METLAQVRQYCIHAEPNYGILWFFYKNSVLDNGIEIWKNAQTILEEEMKADTNERKTEEQWIGSKKLIKILRSGM